MSAADCRRTTWHFIDEYHFFSARRQCLQIIFKRIESIIPCFRLRLAFLGLPLECTHEVLYLDCRRGLVLSYKCEIVFILEEFYL